MKKIFILTSLFALGLLATKANNIQVANVALSDQNTASQFSLVNFDVSWENSWRTITNEANYDGAWIFVKFRKKSSNLWQHATINATGSTVPAGSVIQTSADGKGVWIYQALPNADFTGNVNYTGAKIRWNYGADSVLNTDSVEIRVFAAEMVYVPAGLFRVGSGGAETNHFFEGSTNNPYKVASEAAITISNTAGNLYYSNDNGIGGDLGGPLPASFPKGYKAFWIMKYEASQQQYVDFLNNLDVARANNRYTAGAITGTHPNLTAAHPERAMNGISVTDVLAFSDWAGMRPFTELEYEKACRGFNQAATPNEYPWGNTTISATTVLVNTGADNESANNGNANYNNSVGTPVRTGIYATSASTRESSGGTFYGIMEMAGNVKEVTIGVGNAAGRAFTAVNGDGNLDMNGDANVSGWPGTSAGYSLRGGYYAEAPTLLRVSDRYLGSYNTNVANRVVFIGMRLARTAE